MRLVVTGGAGFIGSHLVCRAVRDGFEVLNVDALTYAGNLESLAEVEGNPRYHFAKIDIAHESDRLADEIRSFRPDAIMHLAAETHVDRSIDGPRVFIDSNVIGTYNMLEIARRVFQDLSAEAQRSFRFHHISSDEVFGALGPEGFFREDTPYRPNSPYSASKAASDHFVRAWHETYGLPTLLTNCSNNYGPHQFPEKLIPLMILNAFDGKALPVYGDGSNVRDWLFVEDHVDALLTVLARGAPGSTYNIGGGEELTNLELVGKLCDVVDEVLADGSAPRRQLINFVADRPGHDHRYAIDFAKIQRELGWNPKTEFITGLRTTVTWYLENRNGWCQRVLDGSYRRERLGLG